MRTLLICHHDNPLNREVLPGFLDSSSDLVGVVVIHETRGRLARRLAFEWRRSHLRMFDVLAFRLYYRLRLAAADRSWVAARVEAERRRYPAPASLAVFETDDPNSQATHAFIASLAPDLTLARCKTLLRPEIFDLPRLGTYVVHPGICPEYRNAHGCFWALAQRDLERVGATLLRIDSGVDTGPIFAYYRADFDECAESHVVIQHRVVFDNLHRIAEDLQRIGRGDAQPIDVSGRTSAAWGQPRLSDYRRWKRTACKRAGS